MDTYAVVSRPLVVQHGPRPLSRPPPHLDHRRWRRVQQLPQQLFKVEFARFAAETGLEVTVCDYPPGTSKWNKVDHRLFCCITMNRRGRPLVSYRTVIEMISATTTKSRLRVRADRDWNWYETGVKISDAELAAVPLTPHRWHGDWNYTVAVA